MSTILPSLIVCGPPIAAAIGFMFIEIIRWTDLDRRR